MQPTIATPYEIQRNSTIGKAVDINTICYFLGIAEENIFNSKTCLGRDFYKSLLADLFVISPAPIAFQPNVVYAVGAYVIFADEIYEVKTTTTGAETPTNSDFFAFPKKFITAANNDIWQGYLIKIIALDVQISICIDLSTPLLAAGAVKNKGETFDSATNSQLDLKIRNLRLQMDRTVENLETFLKENPTLYPCANTCKGLKENILEPQRRNRNRLWGIHV